MVKHTIGGSHQLKATVESRHYTGVILARYFARIVVVRFVVVVCVSPSTYVNLCASGSVVRTISNDDDDVLCSSTTTTTAATANRFICLLLVVMVKKYK